MKVLWFTNTPSCFKCRSNDYNGGGWISSLENEIVNRFPDIKLGICFYYNHKEDEEHCGNVTYFPILRPKKNLLYSIRQLFTSKEKASKKHENVSIPEILEIVNRYKPDIIHVFGSENIYGLISNYTKTPVVLHIQGILSPIWNAYLPPFTNWYDVLFSSLNIYSIIAKCGEKFAWERNAITERRMYKSISHFMGRTKWDKAWVSLMNPTARYYNCGELLRQTFYSSNYNRIIPHKAKFVTIISWPLYKGFDLVLKTVGFLNSINFDFEWDVYGNVNLEIAEKISKKKINQCKGLKLKGVVDSESIKKALYECTAYIHTSYIDNSSNAICEAQILGITCIATNVGGTASLIKNYKTGLLIPSNDPLYLSYLMKWIYDNPDENERIGKFSREVATRRHDRKSIANRVIEIYQEILDNTDKNEL